MTFGILITRQVCTSTGAVYLQAPFPICCTVVTPNGGLRNQWGWLEVTATEGGGGGGRGREAYPCLIKRHIQQGQYETKEAGS